MLLASLIECFFILPAHLAHHGAGKSTQPSWFRRGFDRGFNFIRDRIFGRLVRLAISFRYATLAIAVGLLMLAVGMMSSGRVGFVFFSAPEADNVYVSMTMASGSTRQQTEMMVAEMERALVAVEEEFTDGKKGLVSFAYSVIGAHVTDNQEAATGGANDLRGSMMVELITADQRDVRSSEFVAALREEIRPMPGMERLIVRALKAGHPGASWMCVLWAMIWNS